MSLLENVSRITDTSSIKSENCVRTQHWTIVIILIQDWNIANKILSETCSQVETARLAVTANDRPRLVESGVYSPESHYFTSLGLECPAYIAKQELSPFFVEKQAHISETNN